VVTSWRVKQIKTVTDYDLPILRRNSVQTDTCKTNTKLVFEHGDG